jgi:hypothetical protein
MPDSTPDFYQRCPGRLLGSESIKGLLKDGAAQQAVLLKPLVSMRILDLGIAYALKRPCDEIHQQVT